MKTQFPPGTIMFQNSVAETNFAGAAKITKENGGAGQSPSSQLSLA